MIKTSLRIFSIFLLAACTHVAQAQLTTSLKLSKRQYLAGEPVVAVVTITNHAGQELTFYGDGRTQWLDFMLKTSRGETVTPRGRSNFGKMTIRAGESLSREVNLAQHFHLGEPGDFSVSAVIHMPGQLGGGSSTNRVIFNQSPGAPYWKQKVGIAGKPGQTREFRILNFNGDQKAQIYAQIIDGRTGQNVSTFLLGDVLMLRKPENTGKIGYFMSADNVKWRRPVLPGDTLFIETEILRMRGSIGQTRCRCLVNGDVVSEAELKFALLDR